MCLLEDNGAGAGGGKCRAEKREMTGNVLPVGQRPQQRRIDATARLRLRATGMKFTTGGTMGKRWDLAHQHPFPASPPLPLALSSAAV